MGNLAFIDGQNLFLGTETDNWKLDTKKFRTYLEDSYKVEKVYYFLGYPEKSEQELYKRLKRHGYMVKFREHSSEMIGRKKGNVDTEIVFEMMRLLVENQNFSKLILVTGDGDYKKVVKYFINKNKFIKILFPNKKYSSLYNGIGKDYKQKLFDIKGKIERTG